MWLHTTTWSIYMSKVVKNKIIGSLRVFVRRRSRQIAMMFFAASFILFLLVLLTVVCMIGEWQSPIPIKPSQLVLIGIHVFVFFSIGRRLIKM